MIFRLRRNKVEPEDQQLINEGLIRDINTIAQFWFFGSGAPGFTPPGRAIYIRTDGGAATTLYVWEGAAWVGK